MSAPGGDGAGGAGNAAAANIGGDGGVGVQSSITGAPVKYGAGGGGAGTFAGSGGATGGGSGKARSELWYSSFFTGVAYTGGTAATANLGGGGGGGGWPAGSTGFGDPVHESAWATPGTAGGDGVVIISFPSNAETPAPVFSGLTVQVSYVNGRTVYKCTAGSGTVTFPSGR